MSSTPRNLVEHACDDALRALEAALAPSGAEVKRAFVLLLAKGVPEGERDACTAGTGVEDARELLAFVISQLVAAGDAVGLEIKLVPLHGERGER